MNATLVVVNFHSSEHLRRLLESRHGCSEVVVVDHSESSDEKARLEELAIDHLIVQSNLGYGAGLNTGVKAAAGEWLILSNPDITLSAGAAEAMFQTLGESGVGAAGPRIYWDQEKRWILPQAEVLTWQTELAERFTPRRRSMAYLRLQVEAWLASSSLKVPSLSGALLMTRKEVYESVGGFDPGFFLFFEENDWFKRVAGMGYSLKVVPDAEVTHSVGASLQTAESDYHYSSSYERYRRLHTPGWYRMLFPRGIRGRHRVWPVRRWSQPAKGDILLFSPYPSFIPATACICTGGEDPHYPPLPPRAGEGSFYLGLLRNDRLYQIEPVG